MKAEYIENAKATGDDKCEWALSICVCDAFGLHCVQWYYSHPAVADIGKHQRKSSQTLMRRSDDVGTFFW